jgi:hypothetical protein
MPFTESSRPALCSESAVHELQPEHTFEDVASDTRFLLPLSLVGLNRIAHGTTYHDAVQYLIPPNLVGMLAKDEVSKWESMGIETILTKILRLRYYAEACNISPAHPSEHALEKALLHYLRCVRDDQFRKCVREHRRLREIDEEVAQLKRKVGVSSNDVGEILGEEAEDRVTFIDDERVSSLSHSVDDSHCYET